MSLAATRQAIYDAVKDITGAVVYDHVPQPTDEQPVLSMDLGGISGDMNSDRSILHYVHKASLPTFEESQAEVVAAVDQIMDALHTASLDAAYQGSYVQANDCWDVTFSIGTSPFLGWNQ